MISIYPRKKLDHSFRNIFSALSFVLTPRLNENKILHDIENLWPEENVIVGLSVRTIFDTILTQQKFEDGSEVVMSGITIPDMVEIVEAHGLKIVPVDLDMDSLQVNRDAITSALSKKTVMVVAAHLFGSRMDMTPIYDSLYERPDILIVEDCAQAFDGIGKYTKQSRTDISMFSFGSIKSVTTLGCAIGFAKEPNFQRQIKDSLAKYDRVSNTQFLSKVLKYFMLKFLENPFIYGFFISLCQLMKVDYDNVIISSIRMVKNAGLLETIRKSPPRAQLKYLLHRLSNMNDDHFSKRKEAGDYVSTRLKRSNVHGFRNDTHSYWLFPIRTPKRSILVKALCDAGFDATFTSTQLISINPTDGGMAPENCEQYMSETIYLPVYESLPIAKLEILISVVNDNT